VVRPSNLQGRSLLGLLRGETASHRDFVIAEYADNEEAMVRTPRWKLIYSTGNRRRRDGYALFESQQGPFVQLYDLESDPEELMNLARQTEKAGLIRQLIREVADHLVRTAREPELVPRSNDVNEILKHCLPPRDVGKLAYLRSLMQLG
jgi:arylsulfatase A-like enzyme